VSDSGYPLADGRQLAGLDGGNGAMTARRLPPPWSVIERAMREIGR
jgi:hypothetical protein